MDCGRPTRNQKSNSTRGDMSDDRRYYYTGISKEQRDPVLHAVPVPMTVGHIYAALCGVRVHVDDIGSRWAPAHRRACQKCRSARFLR